MIFVTVGTQPNGFIRCLREVENLIEHFNITEEVIAQIGHTDFETTKFKTIRFMSVNEFDRYISESSVVITHAGSGAIFSSIKAGKKIIAMARLHEYNEMADNHQTELIKKLSENNYLLDGTYSLIDVWPGIKEFNPHPNDFSSTIVSELDKLISKWMKE